jgi:beta-lactamase superfamily II metal-dependent hydrolase
MQNEWQLPLTNGYIPERATNVVGITRLDDSAEIVERLEKACVAPDAGHLETPDLLGALLSTIEKSDLRVTALDVGQASSVAFSNGSRPFGYFDVGAPMFFNQRSFPKRLDHVPATAGFVILSHWDFDHFALAFQKPELKQLQWFAPEQPVGPNTAQFQRSLGSRLTFASSDLNVGAMLMRRCTGTSVRDRNSTGYALRIDLDDAGILLPGDADYRWIQPAIANDVNRIMIPHHGGTGSPPPSPGAGENPTAVVSYGIPNTYRHPNEDQIEAHRRAGWRIRRTAAHVGRPRGNQTLYPI